MNAALNKKGYKSDIQDFNGVQVTPENCKMAINMLNASQDDIIIFYYIGHGGRPSTDAGYMRSHPFPQMCLAQKDQTKFIPLEWVDEQLKAKGARLTITIGMCCNNLDSRISVKDAPDFSPNYGPVTINSKKLQAIEDLFLNTKGHIIATSASPSQTSGCMLGSMGAPISDLYTFALCYLFQQLDKYPQMTWDKFLNAIRYSVNEYSRGTQTPFHKGSLVAATKVGDKTPPVPTEKDIVKTRKEQIPNSTKRQGDRKATDWINELSNHLSILINTKLSFNERQRLEQSLRSLFSDAAKVKFMGQDSDRIIDQMTVKDWLGILATNPNGRILKVVVTEGSFDNDKKIQGLKVREIYKQ